MKPNCPICLSEDPNLVGILKSGADCTDPFHCPSPDLHGNPFRYCPHCNWAEKVPAPVPDTERGLYGKYLVFKAGGDMVPMTDPCFVLRYNTDPHARAALAAYADSCEAEYPQLAADLRQKLAERNVIGERTS